MLQAPTNPPPNAAAQAKRKAAPFADCFTIVLSMHHEALKGLSP
jgi:hypothetical protein